MIPSGTAEEAGGTRPPGETDREDRKRKWSEGPDGGPSRVRQKVDSESSDSGNWQQYLNLSEDKEGKAPSESSSDRGITNFLKQPAAVQQPPSQEAFRELLENHAAVAEYIQEIHRGLRTRVPAGFQAC